MNKDQETRDQIIGEDNFDSPHYSGGMRRFENLTLDQLDALNQGGFINLGESQNSAPMIKEFYDFMKRYPGMTAHGYVISNKRPDYRVSIEGIEYKGDVSKRLMMDFIEAFRHASEFEVTDYHVSCWWD